MKKYDFTKLLDRHGHDALAVDAIGAGKAPDDPTGALETGLGLRDRLARRQAL